MAETRTELWELRYRGPHGKMEDVLVEVAHVNGEPPTEAHAKKVCDSYLEYLANPTFTYVRHRRIVVWSSAKAVEQQKTHRTIHDDENATEARRHA